MRRPGVRRQGWDSNPPTPCLPTAPAPLWPRSPMATTVLRHADEVSVRSPGLPVWVQGACHSPQLRPLRLFVGDTWCEGISKGDGSRCRLLNTCRFCGPRKAHTLALGLPSAINSLRWRGCTFFLMVLGARDGREPRETLAVSRF